jgi:hypothetical protein
VGFVKEKFAMDFVMVFLSLLPSTPTGPETPPERTLHAMAAYVRTVAVKKGLRARRVAHALGIQPCKIALHETNFPSHKELSDVFQRRADGAHLGSRLDRPRRRGLKA